MKATINGISINYDVSGTADGPAVVLHHPLATDLSIWDELTAALAPRYRVVRFDARGHGRSDAPEGPYSFETLTADTIGLMDHLKIRRARFLGLSMGGMVGQYLGLLHPDRFTCLCLVATSSRVPPEGRQMWADRIAAVRQGGMWSQLEGTLGRWLSPDALESKHPAVARVSRLILATPPEGFIGWGGAISTLDVTARLNAIRLPTLVISGALDPSTPPAAGEAIHKQITGSQFIVMPGVSHMLCAEAPEPFHKHVLTFLEKHAKD